MKKSIFKIILTTAIVVLGSLLSSCQDVILDSDQLISDGLPARTTPIDSTTLPSSQAPNNTDNIGRSPIFVSEVVNRVVANKLYSYSIKVDDPDFGDQLKITATKLPSWLELSNNDVNNTELTGTPENTHIGGHLVELVVTDSSGLQSKQIFYVYVLDALTNNNAPTVSNQNFSTREDEELKIILNAEDIDGDTLTYKITTPPKNGELSGEGQQLSYKPTSNSNGKDSFSYTVSDGNESSNEATVNIQVIAINDVPTAQNTELTIDKNKTTEVLLRAEDIETTILTYSIVKEPSFGTLSTLYGNKLTYTPKENFIGEDSFSFKASDGQFASNTAKITFKIEDPIIKPIPEPTPEPSPQSSNYRVLVTTDINLDPDDIQSLYRLVHYSDIFDIEGIIATVGNNGNKPSPDALRQSLRNIQVDLLRAKGYTDLIDEATLLSQVKTGKETKGPVAGKGSEGSNHIIEQVKSAQQRGDSRPLWILVWGAMTDVAQALIDDPSISSSIRIYSIGSVNSTGDLAARNFVFDFVKNKDNNLFWIDNSSLSKGGFFGAYTGVFHGGNQTGEWSANNFINTNIRGHGQAGDLFPLAQPPLKEGDSPTLLYLISPKFGNVGNVDDPTSESWGGTYKRFNNAYPNYYIDCCSSEAAAKQSISKWRVQYLNHWKARWDRYN